MDPSLIAHHTPPRRRLSALLPRTLKRALQACAPTLLGITLGGCLSAPASVPSVELFDVGRYQGTWYEIARLDHWFERGLTNVSATYTPRKDGGVDVVNRGYDPKSAKWKEARGRAYLLPPPAIGRLKVSFFRPFYGAYNVIDLDQEGYGYALVCGPNRSYLWVLARQQSLDPATQARLLAKAKELGFATEKLISVTHDR